MSDDKCREMHFGIPSQKDKYYFVSYQWRTALGTYIPDNKVLLNEHPTEWLYARLEGRDKAVITFYSEITKEQYEKLSEWLS